MVKAPSYPRSRQLHDAHALVIGISAYEHIRRLPAVHDAQDIAAVLADPALCGYPIENVIALHETEATREAILDALDRLAMATSPSSTVFVYFSGHGGRTLHRGDTCFLMPYDARWARDEDIEATAISSAELAVRLGKIRAERMTVVLDCCRAGGLGDIKDIEPELRPEFTASSLSALSVGRGRVIMAASGSDGYAYVRAGERNGIFTQHLLAGLRGGAPGEGGVIRIFELYHYVQACVVKDHRLQAPVFKAFLEDNYPIALAPITGPPPAKVSSGDASTDRRISESGELGAVSTARAPVTHRGDARLSAVMPGTVVHGDFIQVAVTGQDSNVTIGGRATAGLRAGETLAGSSKFPVSTLLNSRTSRVRSGMLAFLRFDAIRGIQGALIGAGVWLAATREAHPFPSLTLLGISTLVIALLGAALLTVNWLRIRLVRHFARQRHEVALRELAALILSRLETPRLLSDISVRGLAVSIEQKHRCPVITDKLIAEAIRAAAIELEHTRRRKDIERGMTILNDLLLSIDKSASPLCSIAVVDRLGAYVQSQPILVYTLLLTLLGVVISPVLLGTNWSWWILEVVTAVTMVAAVLWLSTERAIRYWQPQQHDESNNRISIVSTPGEPQLILDFFLKACCTHAMWADIWFNQLWGPIWEGAMFIWRSNRQLAVMHEFRFDVAQELWRELKRIDIELEERSSQDPAEKVAVKQRFQELARRLWIVTGEPRFRVIEAHGTILREDRDSGITGLL